MCHWTGCSFYFGRKSFSMFLFLFFFNWFENALNVFWQWQRIFYINTCSRSSPERWLILCTKTVRKWEADLLRGPSISTAIRFVSLLLLLYICEYLVGHFYGPRCGQCTMASLLMNLSQLYHHHHHHYQQQQQHALVHRLVTEHCCSHIHYTQATIPNNWHALFALRTQCCANKHIVKRLNTNETNR